jgi:hypothetical protein
MVKGPVVYVPFVAGRLQPATYRAVLQSGFPCQFLALEASDPYGYGRLIRRLWDRGRDFILCEQDVVPTRAQLDTLAGCGHGWCSYGYDDGRYPDGPMFGLARFAGWVMRKHPRAAQVALHTGPGKELEVGWWECDSMLARDLQIRGVAWHRHTPPVRHAHTGPPTVPPT